MYACLHNGVFDVAFADDIRLSEILTYNLSFVWKLVEIIFACIDIVRDIRDSL